MPRRPLSSRRSNPAARMMTLRQWHTYIGAFIAPSVLFFALTGAVQLFSLHEAHDGYKPPLLIEKLAAVHKDQVFAVKAHDDGDHHRPPQAEARKPPALNAATSDAGQIRTWVLKWVFAIVALGLIVSTLLGLWMAFTTGKRKVVVALVVLVGAALPILLLTL